MLKLTAEGKFRLKSFILPYHTHKYSIDDCALVELMKIGSCGRVDFNSLICDVYGSRTGDARASATRLLGKKLIEEK
jgi:hypothetical protein